MSYAIISLGGKQYRVREGERLLVDRLAVEEGKTFHPDVLMLGGEGKFELSPKSVQVTARVVGSPLGKKIRIGKYKPKSGYKRHTGFRATKPFTSCLRINGMCSPNFCRYSSMSLRRWLDSSPRMASNTEAEAGKPCLRPSAKSA